MDKINEFMLSIETTRWFRPDGAPAPAWKLFTAPTWEGAQKTAWEAGWEENREDAHSRLLSHDAAWDAAYAAARDAAWDAAASGHLIDDSYHATLLAVEQRALAMARGYVAGAERIVSWDAKLVAMCLLAGDRLDPRYLAHARLRMDVWRKGYGLAGDLDGVLYVYERLPGGYPVGDDTVMEIIRHGTLRAPGQRDEAIVTWEGDGDEKYGHIELRMPEREVYQLLGIL